MDASLTLMLVLLVSAALIFAMLISERIHKTMQRDAYELYEEMERLRRIDALQKGIGFVRNPNPYNFAREYPLGVSIRVRGVVRFAKIKDSTIFTIFGWDVYKRFGGVRKLFGVVWGYS